MIPTFYNKNMLMMDWGHYLLFYVFDVAYLYKSEALSLYICWK